MSGWPAERPRGPLRLLAGLLAAALLAAACATPASGPARQPQAGKPPATDTPTAGKPIDAAQAQRLQRLMVPLIQVMDNKRPLDQVRVGVVDDPSINAANAGGGQFFVTTGLLQKANDDQLLAILAHEVAHDDLGHVAKAQALGAGLNIGMVILDQIFPGSGAITPLAGQLIARGYSRKEEYAADRHGVELLKRVGRSKDVMISTLDWLLQTTGGGKGGFFSTHPATGERIQALRQLEQ